MKLPPKVNVVEVGPRDGFQNIKTMIPTHTKIEEIELLIAAGVTEIEITSFVHPKAIAQMADAMEVAKYISDHFGERVKLVALVPNGRGAENALACGIHTVTYVISASPSHNRANVNRTIEESLEDLKALIQKFPELEVRLDIATAFGCPFEGDIPVPAVFALADKAVSYGVSGLMFCDTIGVGNPKQVESLAKMAMERYDLPIGLHLHDTRGMGLANTLAGIAGGVTMFETSVGGLGGCPFAPGAAGNTATEDMLNMLERMEIETNIDFHEYMKAVDYVKNNIQVDLTGHMANVKITELQKLEK